MNQKMLSLGEKIQTAPPLIPMLIEGQDFIDRQVRITTNKKRKGTGTIIKTFLF